MHTSTPPPLTASFSIIAERFRRAGQIDRAITLCHEGLAAYPDHLSARVTLGCALLDLGQYEDAHRELQMVVKRAPDNLAAIRGLAELHSRGFEEHESMEAMSFDATDEFADLEAELPADVYQHIVEDEIVHAVTTDAAPLSQVGRVAIDDGEVIAVDVNTTEINAAEIVDEWSDEAIISVPEMSLPPAVVQPAAVCHTMSVPLALREIEPRHFAIEDVIDLADDVAEVADTGRMPAAFDLDPELVLELDTLELPVPAHGVAVMQRPTPEPAPVAALDEWLTRIRARRLELLSEYAAG